MSDDKPIEHIIPENPEADEMSMQIHDGPLDVSNMKLDLDKPEKLRTVALMMGIRYYTDTIIKDPAYLKIMIDYEEKKKFSNDADKEIWHLRPANVIGVVNCALAFENFLRGGYSNIASIKVGGEEIIPEGGRGVETEVEDQN